MTHLVLILILISNKKINENLKQWGYFVCKRILIWGSEKFE